MQQTPNLPAPPSVLPTLACPTCGRPSSRAYYCTGTPALLERSGIACTAPIEGPHFHLACEPCDVGWAAPRPELPASTQPGSAAVH